MQNAFNIEPLRSSSRQTARQEAAESGCLFFRRLIDPGIVLTLRTKALEIADEFGWLADGSRPEDGIARPGVRLGDYDDPQWVAFQARVLPLPEFITLGEHPAILSVLEDIAGGPVHTRRGDICRITAPNTPELTTVPHQDHYYVGGSTDIWTAWIPLGDCPRDLGGLAVLPGSHRHGLLPHAGEGTGRQGVDFQDQVWATIDYRAGDVLLFHCMTIHRALPNLNSNRLRLSADYRYEAGVQMFRGHGNRPEHPNT
jgi:hypothetical protein